jgi:hypothetical protein
MRDRRGGLQQFPDPVREPAGFHQGGGLPRMSAIHPVETAMPASWHSSSVAPP